MGNQPFDSIAAGYDRAFTYSLTGKAQRDRTRFFLEKFLEGRKSLRILEINCGTGEDACWLASLGHQVVATDASPAMIAEAKKKMDPVAHASLIFSVCPFDKLAQTFEGREFDLIFSNFAGLNCVSSVDMPLVSRNISILLAQFGHLAINVFGKRSWWETLYFLAKFKAGAAFRRWSPFPRLAVLKEGEANQEITYYPLSFWKKTFRPLQMIEKKPVGLFIPPSYLEAAMQKRPRFFRTLDRLEQKTNRLSAASSLADHVYLLFKKEEA
jgi:ubiquinone/menaquinone biosynthesis C-methylase UbiE